MTKLNGLLAMGALAMVLTGCKETPDTHDADVKAIQDAEAQWVKDFAAKDADKVAAHYTDDATVMMSGSAAINGKADILAELKKMVSAPGFSVTFHSTDVDVAKSGDIAYSQGKYATTTTDPITQTLKQDHGNYVTVYHKQADGSWKAIDDAMSTEVVPSPPPSFSTAPKGKVFHATPFD